MDAKNLQGSKSLPEARLRRRPQSRWQGRHLQTDTDRHRINTRQQQALTLQAIKTTLSLSQTHTHSHTHALSLTHRMKRKLREEEEKRWGEKLEHNHTQSQRAEQAREELEMGSERLDQREREEGKGRTCDGTCNSKSAGRSRACSDVRGHGGRADTSDNSGHGGRADTCRQTQNKHTTAASVDVASNQNNSLSLTNTHSLTHTRSLSHTQDEAEAEGGRGEEVGREARTQPHTEPESRASAKWGARGWIRGMGGGKPAMAAVQGGEGFGSPKKDAAKAVAPGEKV